MGRPKAIREDEDVAQHHGHDVLRTKAASLAKGLVSRDWLGFYGHGN